jgi:hypothetical protein
LQDSVKVAEYFIVPESKNSEALRRKPRITSSVALRSLGMLPSVELHDDSGVQANEVDYEATNLVLALELPSRAAPRAHVAPEQTFRIS